MPTCAPEPASPHPHPQPAALLPRARLLQRLAPTWDQLADHFKESQQVVIASVDCTEQKDICTKAEVGGWRAGGLVGALMGCYAGRRLWGRVGWQVSAWLGWGGWQLALLRHQANSQHIHQVFCCPLTLPLLQTCVHHRSVATPPSRSTTAAQLWTLTRVCCFSARRSCRFRAPAASATAGTHCCAGCRPHQGVLPASHLDCLHALLTL
jgi:hypothetical protein